jgi:hypothetical protein
MAANIRYITMVLHLLNCSSTCRLCCAVFVSIMSGDVQGGLPNLRSSCLPPAAPGSIRRLEARQRQRQRQRGAVATPRTYPAPHSARETRTLGLPQYASPGQPSTSSRSTSQSSRRLSTPSGFPGYRNGHPGPCPTACTQPFERRPSSSLASAAPWAAATTSNQLLDSSKCTTRMPVTPRVNFLERSYAKEPVNFPGDRSEFLASYPPASQLFENSSPNGLTGDGSWAAVSASDQLLSGAHYTMPMPVNPIAQFPPAITCTEEPVLLSQVGSHAGPAPFDFPLDYFTQLDSARYPSAVTPSSPLSNPGRERLQAEARIGGFKTERHHSSYLAGTYVSRGNVESNGPLGHSAMTTHRSLPVMHSIAESNFHTSLVSPPNPEVR